MSAGLSATRGAPRVLRGAGLAVCCAALGVAGHAAAAGTLPQLGPTVLLTVLLAGAGIALADRQRGLLAIMSTVAVTQLGLHVLLSALAHQHGGAPATAADPVAMTGSHTLAVLLTGWFLVGAERSVFAVVGVLGWLLRRVHELIATLPVGGGARVLPPVSAPGSAVLRLLLRRVHRRRGPPALP